jgi:mono/diheme cytochrome c family protein
MRRTLLIAGLLLAAGAATSEPLTHTEELVARGDYLVNAVMTCNACHTPFGPNGPDMSKRLSGGRSFEDPMFKVTASNITQDKDTGIGNWSDDEIKKLLVTGIRPNGIAVAPAMPTAFYTVLTTRDLEALVAYLRTVPAINHAVPEPQYEIKLPPRQAAPYAKAEMTEADQIDTVKHGRYLATIAHCLECHTPMGKAGKDMKKVGAGGMVFKGPFGESTSANITRNAEKGLGAWTDDEIKRAITQGIARDGHKLKPPMGFTAYARMTPQDLSALVAFVRTLPSRK